jgi:predicted ester cyclase
MSVEENKAIIRHIWDDINRGNLAVIDECFADNFVRYDHNGQIMDRVGYKRMCTFIIKNMPDFHVTIDDMIGEGEKIAFRMTITGTNTGSAEANSPTEQRVTYKEVYFTRFEKAKVVEYVNLNRDISPQ